MWSIWGWILQELLAPTVSRFFDKEWRYLGGRHDLISAIASATNIDVDDIETRQAPPGAFQITSEEPCVAQKMGWLSRRRTSRIEDMAYCMLGLFGVNKPLLYRGGPKAFLRLQLETIRKGEDESIFAWRKKPASHELPDGTSRLRSDDVGHPLGLLAQNPGYFARSGRIKQYREEQRPVEKSPSVMTNQGLQIHASRSTNEVNLPLNCSQSDFPVEVMPHQMKIAYSPIVVGLQKQTEGQDKYWQSENLYAFYPHNLIRKGQDQPLSPIYVRQDGL